MSLDTESKKFWDGSDLEGEQTRLRHLAVAAVANLCPSFNDMFERLDRQEVDGDAGS
jgi:hypothetical protein